MSWRKQLPVIVLAGVLLWAAWQLFGRGRFSSLETDTEKAIISTAALMRGGPPPQGIPALGFGGAYNGSVGASPAPRFESVAEAAGWLEPKEPVIAVTVAGQTKAYPLQILTWHEIVNDTLGHEGASVPLAVSFCPLCNSAFAFDLRAPLTEALRQEVLAKNPNAALVPLDEAFLAAYAEQEGDDAVTDLVAGLQVTFGTSGMLYKSNLVMFDSQTGSLWPQVMAAAGVGTLAGVKLLRYPAQIVAFEEVQRAMPDALVLSRRTGYNRSYGQNPYPGYDRVDNPPFLYRGPTDGRLPPKMRVVTLERRGEAAAYPFSTLADTRVVNDQVADLPLVVLWRPGTRSALDDAAIARGEDVGAVAVFDRRWDGRTLTFRWDGTHVIDEETGSSWDIFGRAVSGELTGAQLTPVVHDNTLWFAWAAFRPDTRIYAVEAP